MRTIFCIMLIAACAPSVAQTMYETRMVDARRFKEAKRDWKQNDTRATFQADLAQHKHHDVSVYRYADMYKVTYYQSENGIMNTHGFQISTLSPAYDHARYSWTGDTLNICFFTGTLTSKIYKAYGWAGTSAIKDE